MSFQAPLFLLGLAVVPLALAALALARRRPARYAVRFPALPTLAAVAPRGAALAPAPPAGAAVPRARRARARAGAARRRPSPCPVEQASVVLVTDTSGSMNATDVEPTRLAAAKAAAERFLDRVPDELRVGLVAYSDAPHTVLRPTEDRDAVRAAVERLAADGGTATGDALDERAARARHPRRRRARPPRSCCSPTARRRPAATRPRSRARRRAAGVPVYTVALGTPDGQVEAERPGPARAARPGGAARGRAAVGRRGVRRRGRRRARRGLRAARLADRHARGAARDQRGFAAAGLLLLGGALGGSLRWRGRLP